MLLGVSKAKPSKYRPNPTHDLKEFEHSVDSKGNVVYLTQCIKFVSLTIESDEEATCKACRAIKKERSMNGKCSKRTINSRCYD